MATPTSKTPAKKPVTKKKVEAASETQAVTSNATKTAKFAHVLVSPRVSEKAAMLAAKGVYVFNVPVSINKIEVQKAVEALYGVKVTSVNTVRGIGKFVRRGRTEGQRNAWKKALVTLAKGQKLDLYEGV